jgi:hypothetical protein
VTGNAVSIDAAKAQPKSTLDGVGDNHGAKRLARRCAPLRDLRATARRSCRKLQCGRRARSRFADNVGDRQSGHEEQDLTMSEATAFFLLDSIG